MHRWLVRKGPKICGKDRRTYESPYCEGLRNMFQSGAGYARRGRARSGSSFGGEGQWRDPGSARIGDCGHGHDWCGKMLQHSHVNRAPSLAAGRRLVERVQLGIRDEVVGDVHDHILSEPQRLLLFPSCIPAHAVPSIAATLYVGGAARVSTACRNIDGVRWGLGGAASMARKAFCLPRSHPVPHGSAGCTPHPLVVEEDADAPGKHRCVNTDASVRAERACASLLL